MSYSLLIRFSLNLFPICVCRKGDLCISFFSLMILLTLNHKSKIKTCNSVLTRPQMAETRLRYVETTFVKNCTAISPALYNYTIKLFLCQTEKSGWHAFCFLHFQR